MPSELSAEAVTMKRPAFDLGTGSRLAMIALGYLPLLHVAATIGFASLVASTINRGAGVLTGIALLYLLPPLGAALARPLSLLTTLAQQPCATGSPAFMRWWYITQWQVVFNRVPLLEEVLRLVPGLYSTWLRLWGAEIGAFVYWSPGVKLFDRSFLRIGARVVIGADTKICPHMIARQECRQSDREQTEFGRHELQQGGISSIAPASAARSGETYGGTELILSPIVIGDDALIGGSTLLPAGVSIAACEQTPGGRPMAPFAHYCNGRHQRTTRFASVPASITPVG
jgi:acetyltransferase-like isoleucine patch superfamily enzyme